MRRPGRAEAARGAKTRFGARHLAFATLLRDEGHPVQEHAGAFAPALRLALGGSTELAHGHLPIERFDPEFTGCPER
jgi:hypothetical protein